MLWWVLFQGLCFCLRKPSARHSISQCGEAAAAPELLSVPKAEVRTVTLGMSGEGLKLAAAVLSVKFFTQPLAPESDVGCILGLIPS